MNKRVNKGKTLNENKVIVYFGYNEEGITKEYKNEEEAKKEYEKIDTGKDKIKLKDFLKMKICKHEEKEKTEKTYGYYECCKKCGYTKYVNTETIEQIQERNERAIKKMKEEEIKSLKEEIERKKRKLEKLEELIIQNNRISIPFTEQNRNVSVLTAEEIKTLPAKSINELLTYISGVDIRLF